MPSISYLFNTPSNYTFNASDIEVTGGLAQLVNQSGALNFNEDFVNDTGFTYDNTKAEFTGGLVRQIALPNGTFAADYASSIDGTWGDGVLTGTPTGSPIITAGKLDLRGGTIKYVDYPTLGNADSLQVGAIRFKVTPNYTGNPSSQNTFITIGNSGNTNNLITINHGTSAVSIAIFDSTSGTIVNNAVFAWAPTAGVEYEFELNWDITAGATRLFVDGVQKGSTYVGTGTRTSPSMLRVGANWSGVTIADHQTDDVIVFDAVQHTANYTPGYDIDRYEDSTVQLPLFTHAMAGTLLTLTSLVTTQVGSPRYTFEIGANGHVYWNGTAWVASDGTYAQANDLATANTNLPTLSVNLEATIHVHIHFTNGNILSSVDDLTINYTGNTVYTLTNPKITPTTTINQDALISWLATLVEPGTDSVRFALKVGTQDYYWGGAAWVVADGTFTQTNDLATVQANLSTFAFNGALTPVIHLHTNDGSTTPNIQDLTLSVNFFGGAATTENICNVWGYLYDQVNAPIASANVVVTPTQYGLTSDKVISTVPTTVTTNSSGYWEIGLVETATDNNNWGYMFNVGGKICHKFVPNTASENFNDLVDV